MLFHFGSARLENPSCAFCAFCGSCRSLQNFTIAVPMSCLIPNIANGSVTGASVLTQVVFLFYMYIKTSVFHLPTGAPPPASKSISSWGTPPWPLRSSRPTTPPETT